jgi:adenosylhomocysteine nucleosidase
MIAIIAALPREIAGLVRGTKPDAALLGRGIHLHRLSKAVVVAAGMGANRATVAVDAAMSTGDVTELISIGLAGACSPELVAGVVSEAATVIDTRTGERYRTTFESGSLLATIDTIAGVREKARLAETYGAAIVDMEAATVGRLAMARGLGFRAIKGISDAHDFEMESLARFAEKDGQFRTLVLHTAVRPHRWPVAMQLGRNSKVALKALTDRVAPLISE